MTVLLVQLTQLLFLLFTPPWPRFLSDALTGMSCQFPILKEDFPAATWKPENYRPVVAVALGHLAHRAHIFPEQQFDVRLVVLRRQRKETAQHILGKGDQFLGQKAQISNWLCIKSRMVCVHCADMFDLCSAVTCQTLLFTRHFCTV